MRFFLGQSHSSSEVELKASLVIEPCRTKSHFLYRHIPVGSGWMPLDLELPLSLNFSTFDWPPPREIGNLWTDSPVNQTIWGSFVCIRLSATRIATRRGIQTKKCMIGLWCLCPPFTSYLIATSSTGKKPDFKSYKRRQGITLRVLVRLTSFYYLKSLLRHLYTQWNMPTRHKSSQRQCISLFSVAALDLS